MQRDRAGIVLAGLVLGIWAGYPNLDIAELRDGIIGIWDFEASTWTIIFTPSLLGGGQALFHMGVIIFPCK